MKEKTLTIPWLLWLRLLSELKKRGRGERESGAFILGKLECSKACHFICYDDLDDQAFDTGVIVFRGQGFTPLWAYCKAHKLKVLADVHTHANGWVQQSHSDQQNPMISQQGHFAFIIPYFARRPLQTLKNVGIYEYLGERKWKKLLPAERRIQLSLL